MKTNKFRLVIPSLVEKAEKEGISFDNDDSLNRKSYGVSLMNLILRSSDELVISLDGDWGDGKTTFIKMWQNLLESKKVPNVYINAFENDYVDDAFMLVASAITSYAEKHIKKDKLDKLDKLKKMSKKVGSRFLPLSVKILLRTATMGILKDGDIDALKDIQKNWAENKSNILGELIEERLDLYEQDIEQIRNFKKELSKLPPLLQEGTEHPLPLIIIIDELDRCKPTFAVEIIEKIKHLFSAENITFVLVMNKSQIEKTMKHLYGFEEEDAHTYLQKYINVETKIPKVSGENYDTDVLKYTKKLIESHGLDTPQGNSEIAVYVEILGNHLSLSLRQLEKVFTNLMIIYGSIKEEIMDRTTLIVFLAVLKVFKPSLFDEILHQKASYVNLHTELNLAKLIENSRKKEEAENLYHWIKVYAADEKEFKELQKNKNYSPYFKSLEKFIFHVSIGIDPITSFYAKKLNMFEIS